MKVAECRELCRHLCVHKWPKVDNIVISIFVVILVDFDKYWMQHLRRAGLSGQKLFLLWQGFLKFYKDPFHIYYWNFWIKRPVQITIFETTFYNLQYVQKNANLLFQLWQFFLNLIMTLFRLGGKHICIKRPLQIAIL